MDLNRLDSSFVSFIINLVKVIAEVIHLTTLHEITYKILKEFKFYRNLVLSSLIFKSMRVTSVECIPLKLATPTSIYRLASLQKIISISFYYVIIHFTFIFYFLILTHPYMSLRFNHTPIHLTTPLFT